MEKSKFRQHPSPPSMTWKWQVKPGFSTVIELDRLDRKELEIAITFKKTL